MDNDETVARRLRDSRMLVFSTAVQQTNYEGFGKKMRPTRPFGKKGNFGRLLPLASQQLMMAQTRAINCRGARYVVSSNWMKRALLRLKKKLANVDDVI